MVFEVKGANISRQLGAGLFRKRGEHIKMQIF